MAEIYALVIFTDVNLFVYFRTLPMETHGNVHILRIEIQTDRTLKSLL